MFDLNKAFVEMSVVISSIGQLFLQNEIGVSPYLASLQYNNVLN